MSGYILKITIENTKPSVWRRIVIPENITFQTLHEIIQIIFGWEDMHLHDFQTNDGKVCITEEEDGYADVQCKESDTRVNEFLKNYKWIRYTYDFGDEWRHKIVLEKEDPAYEYAHAQVLKYKGDNFIEDYCWNLDEVNEEAECYGRNVFDPEVVNGLLQNMKYSFSEEEPQTDMIPENVLSLLQEAMRLQNIKEKMEAIISENKNGSPKREACEIDLIIKELTRFSYERNAWVQKNPKQSDIPYEWRLRKTTRSTTELLAALDKKLLMDYCKYWQISVRTNAAKKKLAETLAQAFYEDPLNLCYVFDEAQMKELQGACDGLIQQTFTDNQMEWIVSATALGLLQAEVVTENDREVGYLAVTEEAADMIQRLKDLPWKKRIKQNREIALKIEKIRNLYMLVDFDTIDQKLREWWNLKVERDELKKLSMDISAF